MKCSLLLAGVLVSCSLSSAPVAKTEPVAEGFLVWQGVSQKNYIYGREICPSDLRHRVVVVMEVEPNEKFFDQVLLMGKVAIVNPVTYPNDSENWETRVLPRHTIVLVSVRGGGKNVVVDVKRGLSLPKDSTGKTRDLNMLEWRYLNCMKSGGVSYYADVVCQSTPNSAGNRPYAYVLGAAGTELCYKGPLNEGTVNDIKAAAVKAQKNMSAEWIPFYGSVLKPKFCTILGKTLEKGKTAKTCPLASVSKSLLKDIVAQDKERAAESQVLYDAIEQTRSDLLLRILLEYKECPYRAYYDSQMLLKYWPGEKSRLDVVAAALKENPEVRKLSQMYCKVMIWADPEFTCKNAGEAKKIVGELSKMKKDLEKLKESKVIAVQNSALLMDAHVDELIDAIPSRLPEKQ